MVVGQKITLKNGRKVEKLQKKFLIMHMWLNLSGQREKVCELQL